MKMVSPSSGTLDRTNMSAQNPDTRSCSMKLERFRNSVTTVKKQKVCWVRLEYVRRLHNWSVWVTSGPRWLLYFNARGIVLIK
jgi:hypothetical protein